MSYDESEHWAHQGIINEIENNILGVSTTEAKEAYIKSQNNIVAVLPIYSKLSWSKHIHEITKGFLQCSLCSCLIPVKANCYKSLVKPIIGTRLYCMSTTHLKGLKYIYSIDSVPRHAKRFIFNVYHSTLALQKWYKGLKWQSLSGCNHVSKIVHNLIDIPLTHLTPVTSIYHLWDHSIMQPPELLAL